MDKPNLYIIAGCNGSGKTTASYTILPEILKCEEFINADEIARGLSPFHPEKSAIQAGKLMLRKIDDAIHAKKDFAFETTLATKTHNFVIKSAQSKRYLVTLVFFWLESTELAIQRVKNRVSEGGHNIPSDVISRRYERGLKNFFEVYEPMVNEWIFIDNSQIDYQILAKKDLNQSIEIKNDSIWTKIKKQYER